MEYIRRRTIIYHRLLGREVAPKIRSFELGQE